MKNYYAIYKIQLLLLSCFRACIQDQESDNNHKAYQNSQFQNNLLSNYDIFVNFILFDTQYIQPVLLLKLNLTITE